MELRKLDFVKQQLSQYSGLKKIVNDSSTFVCCPFHSEATPSFRIFHSVATKSPGWGKCYGCGRSEAFDKFAEKLGLKPYSYSKPTDQFAQLKISNVASSDEEKLTFSELPANRVWRSIPTNFLAEMGCKLVANQWKSKFVFMPVLIFGEERGYIKARLRKAEGKPSYINKKGNWSENYGLFPYDYVLAQSPTVIALVEGPRDSARFNLLGIPTLAILGTQSWSETKSRLVTLIGADWVILVMDGDCAGIKATKKIKPLLSRMVNVRTFSLSGSDSPYHQFRDCDEPSKAAKAAGVHLWDPGNCPLHKVDQLKQLVEKLSS